jgi:transposase
MQAVKTIGLDIAKSVFQVHGVDAEGRSCRGVSWGSRPVPPRIIGHANSRRLAIPCG